MSLLLNTLSELKKIWNCAMMTRQEISSLEGKAVYKKYGSEYMRQLGRKGAMSLHRKYAMIPYGCNEFQYVLKKISRISAMETGKWKVETKSGAIYWFNQYEDAKDWIKFLVSVGTKVSSEPLFVWEYDE